VTILANVSSILIFNFSNIFAFLEVVDIISFASLSKALRRRGSLSLKCEKLIYR